MNLQMLAVLYFLVPVGHVHIRTQHIRDREGWDVSQNIAVTAQACGGGSSEHSLALDTSVEHCLSLIRRPELLGHVCHAPMATMRAPSLHLHAHTLAITHWLQVHSVAYQ